MHTQKMPSQKETMRRRPTRTTHQQVWSFALSLYAKEGIKEACLDLQDRGGVDIPVLLCTAFSVHGRQVELSATEIAAMDELARDLRRDYIEPLRRMRRQLKTAKPAGAGSNPGQLRDAILKAELLAEREQIAKLTQYICARPSTAGSVNIERGLRTVCSVYFEKCQRTAKDAAALDGAIMTIAKALASMP